MRFTTTNATVAITPRVTRAPIIFYFEGIIIIIRLEYSLDLLNSLAFELSCLLLPFSLFVASSS